MRQAGSEQSKSGAHTIKEATTISIDLAKNVFQVAVFNTHGNLKSNQTMSSRKMTIMVAQHHEAGLRVSPLKSSSVF